jgi:hypothetical protein
MQWITGQTPDWFPTPDHVAEEMGRSDGDSIKWAVAITLVILMIPFCVYCFYLTVFLFHSYQSKQFTGELSLPSVPCWLAILLTDAR